VKDAPSPEQAAAVFSGALIFVKDLPGIAARWLAEGHDSESLRLTLGDAAASVARDSLLKISGELCGRWLERR
jgi:hypothetical protein